MSQITILKQSRGRLLLYGDHQYHFHTKYKNLNSLWRCRYFKKTKCAGTITITQDESKVVKPHSHSNNCLSDENKNAVCQIISSSIETATTSEETVSAIYKQTVASFRDKGLHLVEKLPRYENYKAVAYRRINKNHGVQKMAHSVETEVEICNDHKDFVLADYSHESKRILIFASEEAREIIRNGKIFFCDGTFKKCPKPFKQLYVIFCDLGSTEDKNFIVPVLYILLGNKKKETYFLMLEMIKSQIPGWNPSKFISDYEQSFIGAIRSVFPVTKHHGCYYHFQNQLWRKAKLLNLKKNNRTRKYVCLCTVLPLLPVSRIDDGWEYIVSENEVVGDDNNNVQTFLSYVNKFWMSKKTLWCCFGERHRTNNVCEGWNGYINNCFKRRPPTINKFLAVLKQDAAFNAVHALTKYPYKNRAKYVKERNKYIMHVQMQLTNGDINVPLFLEKLR